MEVGSCCLRLHSSTRLRWVYSPCKYPFQPKYITLFMSFQQVVVLKDQTNKKAHEESAQMACEAAGAIRTVASLTRENDCLKTYSSSLELPLKHSMHAAVWANLLYSFSQAAMFFVISLIFWFGSRLVANQEFSTFQFFIGLMVS